MENQTQIQDLEQVSAQLRAERARAKRFKLISFILIPIIAVLAFTGGYFSRYIFNSDNSNTAADIVALMDKVGYVYDPVTGEEREITQEEIADLLVRGFLDEYSDYYTKEEYNTVNANAEGRYSGFGMTIAYNGMIVDLTYNSPAELAGIKIGDIAVSANLEGGEVISHGQNDGADFRNLLLNAPSGQKVVIVLDRAGEQITVEVVKSAYVASYVKYYESDSGLDFRTGENGKLQPISSEGGMSGLAQDTGYIRLVSFRGDADEQIADAIEYMTSRGRTKLILDLRDNGGGYTDVLEDVASHFIYNGGERKNLIAYASGKSTSDSFYTSGNEFNQKITAIAVIANGNTASASESLIGAMLHYGDCFSKDSLIIEKNAEGVAKTYGKGIMQTTYRLIDGGAIKLTTAKIYLPDKTTSIHTKGFIAEGANAVEVGGAISRAIEVLA